MSNYSDSMYEEGANNSWSKAFHLIPPQSTVLDIGCSSGNFGKELISRRGCTVDGIELDAEDAKIAAKHLRNVYHMNIETDNLSKIKEKYDIIYMGDVIEHLFYTIATLERCKSLLKPNGALVFSVPNMGHISVRLLLLRGDFDYTETGLLDKTHIHFFNLKELKRVLSEAGYSIKTLTFVEKDYPKELIKKYCEELGIRVTNKFYQTTSNVDAAAFQFVGVAVPGKVKHHKLQQFGPIDFFEKFHTDTISELERSLATKNDEINHLRSENEILRKNAINTIKDFARKNLRKSN